MDEKSSFNPLPMLSIFTEDDSKVMCKSERGIVWQLNIVFCLAVYSYYLFISVLIRQDSHFKVYSEVFGQSLAIRVEFIIRDTINIFNDNVVKKCQGRTSNQAVLRNAGFSK